MFPSQPNAPRRPSLPLRSLHGRASVGASLALLIVLGLTPAASASQATTAVEAAATTNAAAGTLEGIDVSHWQNTIDWYQVAAAGKRFAYMKVRRPIRSPVCCA